MKKIQTFLIICWLVTLSCESCKDHSASDSLASVTTMDTPPPNSPKVPPCKCKDVKVLELNPPHEIGQAHLHQEDENSSRNSETVLQSGTIMISNKNASGESKNLCWMRFENSAKKEFTKCQHAKGGFKTECRGEVPVAIDIEPDGMSQSHSHNLDCHD